jgi:hypothetical protein
LLSWVESLWSALIGVGAVAQPKRNRHSVNAGGTTPALTTAARAAGTPAATLEATTTTSTATVVTA